MSLSANKTDIYNKVKLYLSMANSNIDNSQSITDILSSTDSPLNFIFDLTKITIGENGLETLAQVALTKVISQKYLDTISDKIYDYVANNISSTLQFSGATIDIPLPTIDPTNVFKKPDPVLGTGTVATSTTQTTPPTTTPSTTPPTTTPQVLKTINFVRLQPNNSDVYKLDNVHGALGSARLSQTEILFENKVSDELKNQFNQGKKPDVANIKVRTYIQYGDIITEASCDIIESKDGIAYTIFTTRGSIGNDYIRRHDEQIDYPNGDTTKPKKHITKRLEETYNGVAKTLSVNSNPPGPFVITFNLNGNSISYKQSFFVASEYSNTQAIINQATGQAAAQLNNQVNQFSKTLKNQVLKQANQSIPINLGTTNKQITLKYNETQNVIQTTIPSLGVLELFTGLRLIIGPMFSSNVIINEILNILFHTDFTQEDAQVLTIVRSYTNYETKDAFKMDLKKLLDLELDSSSGGYNIDVSCFRENITITKGQIDKIITNPTVENLKTLVPEFGTDISTTQNNNAKQDFFKKIIEAIGEAILSMIIKQPVIMFFISLYHKIIDFAFDLKTINIAELIDKFKAFLQNLFDNLYEEVICVFFNWLKKYLLKLVVAVTIILLKEQLEKRRDILLSLTGPISQNLKKLTV
jgi:hypothetical protein